jgi:hypothetical protein
MLALGEESRKDAEQRHKRMLGSKRFCLLKLIHSDDPIANFGRSQGRDHPCHELGENWLTMTLPTDDQLAT